MQIVGPIGSVLANIYGCNKVAMLGSLLAASGFLLSAIVYEPVLLCFTFGVIGGMQTKRQVAQHIFIFSFAGGGLGLVFLYVGGGGSGEKVLCTRFAAAERRS